MNERTFTNVDDNVLIALISGASERVVFVAPGLRKAVANALGETMQRLPSKVTVVLDVDAEVCRLGFGDAEGLEAISIAADTAGIKVLHQPGVRIGLLIVDGSTTVYSPTPLLIEAGSTQADKPNGIVLTDNVPAAIEKACGLGGAAGGQPQVGIVPLDAGKLEAVKQDLRASPPKEFDIARIERVFNSALHFVELEILNYRFSAKKVRLDAELFGMGDDYLRERVENTFKPFADAEFLTVQIPKLSAAGEIEPNQAESFGPPVIEQERKRLKRAYLFDVPRFGVVIRRENRDEFEKRLRLLEKRMKLYIEAVQKTIASHIGKAKEKLKTSLVEVVTKNPPPAWKKFMDDGSLSPDEAGRLLDEALLHAFAGMVSEFAPEIRWIYKDVTYETIHSSDFRAGLEKAFGKARAAKLFSEHDAAPEKH
jgi:hypothetical protein